MPPMTTTAGSAQRIRAGIHFSSLSPRGSNALFCHLFPIAGRLYVDQMARICCAISCPRVRTGTATALGRLHKSRLQNFDSPNRCHQLAATRRPWRTQLPTPALISVPSKPQSTDDRSGSRHRSGIRASPACHTYRSKRGYRTDSISIGKIEGH